MTTATPIRPDARPPAKRGTIADAVGGVSTLDYACPRKTVYIDTGAGNTAVGLLDGADLLNCAVLRPREGGPQREADVDDADRELWAPSGRLVSLFDAKPDGRYRTMAEMVAVLRGVAWRVRFAHDWLIDRYADPDEPVHVVVEVPEGVPRGHAALAQTLTLELAAMVAIDLDCDEFAVESRLCIGERHRGQRNPTGRSVPVEWCYPERAFGAWPEFAAAGVDGGPVRMLPNEDVGKRHSDELQPRRRMRDVQSVVDGGKFYWMTEGERDRFRLPARPPKARRKARRAS